jgi:PAS domain-containing protein
MKWLSDFSKYIRKFDPRGLGDVFMKIECKFHEFETFLEEHSNGLQESMEKMEKKLLDDIALLEKDLEFKNALIENVVENLPNMVWAKDLNGKYIYANRSIRENLLFDADPLGKDDVELSQNAKKIFGNENHTFGEVCGNSDQEVKDKVSDGTWRSAEEDGRFFEYGKVKGKMVYLEVIKEPMYIDGVFAGVMGAGWVQTPYVELEQKMKDCPLECSRECLNSSIFDIFKFENKEEKL